MTEDVIYMLKRLSDDFLNAIHRKIAKNIQVFILDSNF